MSCGVDKSLSESHAKADYLEDSERHAANWTIEDGMTEPFKCGPIPKPSQGLAMPNLHDLVAAEKI